MEGFSFVFISSFLSLARVPRSPIHLCWDKELGFDITRNPIVATTV